ncbi:MAG: site-specific DNA-methyltransferase [Bacilli bacterium]|nr:site-specific DNA-methyltransferase [Bacilli bacterium]
MIECNNIYNCDYRDKIKNIEDESIDLVLTDIPYMISKKTNFKSIKDYTNKNGKSNYHGMEYKFEDENFCDIEDYINECWRILKTGGNLIVWSSWQMLGDIEAMIKNKYDDKIVDKFVKKVRVGVWIKNNPIPQNIDIMPVNSTEMFLCIAKGSNATFNKVKYDNNKLLKGSIDIKDAILKSRDKEERIKNASLEINDVNTCFNESYERLIYIEPIVSKSDNIHPTQKPLNIIRHLVELYSNRNETVFDGLMGSGVTAVASKLTGRNYIGFEIDEEYYKKSVDRINNIK